jgi:hypothetical protein
MLAGDRALKSLTSRSGLPVVLFPEGDEWKTLLVQATPVQSH